MIDIRDDTLPGFYPDTLGLGENRKYWWKVIGAWGCASSGVQGQTVKFSGVATLGSPLREGHTSRAFPVPDHAFWPPIFSTLRRQWRQETQVVE